MCVGWGRRGIVATAVINLMQVVGNIVQCCINGGLTDKNERIPILANPNPYLYCYMLIGASIAYVGIAVPLMLYGFIQQVRDFLSQSVFGTFMPEVFLKIGNIISYKFMYTFQ